MIDPPFNNQNPDASPPIEIVSIQTSWKSLLSNFIISSFRAEDSGKPQGLCVNEL